MSCPSQATRSAAASSTRSSRTSTMRSPDRTSPDRSQTWSARASPPSSRRCSPRNRRSSSAPAPSDNTRLSAELFKRLRERAVEIHVEDHLRQRLARGDSLRVKLGLDPTAPDLHVGHLVVLDALRAFQDDGHVVVLIIGDYTALIGDPSGRSETRPVLNREQIDANAKTYFDQVFLVMDRDRTEIHGNAEWLGELAAADVL